MGYNQLKCIQTGFGSGEFYNEKCLKTKIRSYHGKISTNCHDSSMSKEGSYCIFFGQ